MAKRKTRGRKQPAWKKWAKAGLGIAGTAIGATVAFSPTFRGITEMFTDPQAGARSLVFDLSGLDITGEVTQAPDISRLIGTGITVGVGIGIMSLFRYFARRI